MTTVVQPTAPTGMAAGRDIQSRIHDFVAANGLTASVRHTDYPDTNQYKPGMSVPMCFADQIPGNPVCRVCPIKIDCNQLTNT